ncbi:MAG: hypothetical protein ACKV2T_28730 [Kofleriaceae bacterium]
MVLFAIEEQDRGASRIPVITPAGVATPSRFAVVTSGRCQLAQLIEEPHPAPSRFAAVTSGRC